MLTDRHLTMLRKVRDGKKLELEDIEEADLRIAMRLTMEGFLDFDGSWATRTGGYYLTPKGQSAL